MTTQYVHEASRDVPVRGEYDVIVAGGGLGGIAAALASARCGARTLLVERNSFVGGVATAGMCCSIFNCYYTSDHRLGPTGIPVEIADALAEAMGYGKKWHDHKGHIIYDIELGKLVLGQMLEDAGVEMLLSTRTAAAVMDGNRIRGIIVESTSGREAILAKAVVDATGEADVAQQAGAELVGANPKGEMHSLCFRLGNVSSDAFADYFRANPDQYPAYMDVEWDLAEMLAQYEDCGTILFPHGGGIQMKAFQQAKADGVLPEKIGLHDTTDACQMHLMRDQGIAHVVTGFVRFDGVDVEKITQSVNDGRRMAFILADVYRRYIPGFERAFVAGVAANLGVRFSRRIVGDGTLTKASRGEQPEWPDAVGRCVLYDHQKMHAGEGAWGAQVMSDQMFQIPRSCLLPKGIDGLIMGAGRSAATDQYWILRVMVTTMAVGQGAGVVAAEAVKRGTTPREVGISAVQNALSALGADV
jgi:ribulose 1,5-bisphosphate synthetase/thiazole synthase